MYKLLLGLLFAVLVSGTVWAGKDPVFSTSEGAIRGYDPVAYFTEGRPVKGARAHHSRYQDSDWYFTSAENLALFQASPEKYAPQYGGYCAWAVSKGYTASIDPKAWTVRDGKLYLNYSKGVQRDWLEDVPGNIAKANKNWPSVLN
ncbi:MAG: YHS domain-containing protein [Sedimenticola sp.]|nr:YHS domain-containing protein [Sedimenticola sp.]